MNLSENRLQSIISRASSSGQAVVFGALGRDFEIQVTLESGGLTDTAAILLEGKSGTTWETIRSISLNSDDGSVSKYIAHDYDNIKFSITSISGGFLSAETKTGSKVTVSRAISGDTIISALSEGAIGNGVTDDTLNLQNVIDNAPPYSRIEVPSGTYIVSRVDPGTTDYCLNINKPLEIHLMLGATIKLADADITNGTDDCYMVNISSSNVFIDGYGSIDMNKSGQTDTTIGTNIATRNVIEMNGVYDNIQIRDIQVYDALGSGIHLKGALSTTPSTNIKIQNARVDQAREGISLQWLDNVVCTNNTLLMDKTTGAQDGIQTSECNNSIVNDNYVQDALTHGINMFGEGEQTSVVGNIIDQCGSGVSLGHHEAGVAGFNLLCAGNVISNVLTGYGIEVFTVSGAQRVIIEGNIIYNVVTLHAINLGVGSEISVLNNHIDTCTIGNGVFVRSGVDSSVVSGNYITNLVGGSGIGIRCDADNCTISDNKIIGITSFGMQIAGDNNFINANNMSTEIIDDNGTSNIKINNNVTTAGLNNVGATTPIDHDNVIGGIWTV